MKYAVFYLIILAIPLSYGCSKKDETYNSKNSGNTNNNLSKASCYVNGTYWSDCKLDSTWQGSNAKYWVGIIESVDISFHNTCTGFKGALTDIRLHLYNFNGIGTYPVKVVAYPNEQSGATCTCLRVFDITYNTSISYATPMEESGQVTITAFDTATKTISGKFYFNAVPDTYQIPYHTDSLYKANGYFDTIYVKNGKFDSLPYTIRY